MVATPHHLHTRTPQVLSGSIAFDTPGAAAGVVIGRLPAGAIITGATINVQTVFNAATNNFGTVGFTGTGTDIADATAAAFTALGGKSPTAGNGKRVAADTDVFVSYTQSGTAASTGLAHVIVTYVPPSIA